jgi:mannose-6-phosphate isomerase-like protein (cupin superfamily)
MPVVYHRDRPLMLSKSGQPALAMVVNHEVGASALSVWVTCHGPGEVVPLHVHDVEEVLTFLEGEGTATVGDKTVAIEPHMSIIVPPQTPHGYANTGEGPLRIVITLADPTAQLGRLVEPAAATAPA